MFVKEAISGDLIRVDAVEQMVNPTLPSVQGRRQAGEEEQDLANFEKSTLVFPSGEPLPQCWREQACQPQCEGDTL